MKERYKFMLLVAVFLTLYFTPFETVRVSSAILEGVFLLNDYVREHTLTCLIPALFIAGAISVMVSQASVIKYFGADAKRIVAYGVASVSGSILAVCSCTILPLFAGIYKRGAGLGPAITFVYSGPAINILAIVLTARVLGWELGVARAFGSIFFSVIIGVMMALIFREDKEAQPKKEFADDTKGVLPVILLFFFMSMVLIFATWAKPISPDGWFAFVHRYKWAFAFLSLVSAVGLSFVVMDKEKRSSWMSETWEYAKQIMPLLFIGVLVAGVLLGRPGHEGLIPSKYVAMLVGGNGFGATFFASIVGAFMYFATLTEIPILQGLLGSGMGKGPALALLLSGPALSLPSMLVIRSVIGWKKTIVYVALVIIMSTIAGMLFGRI